MPPVVLVVWLDHFSGLHEISAEDAAKLTPLRRMAVGWVLADTEAGITLAMDVPEEYDGHGDPYLFLGREMVSEVIPLHAGPVLGDED
jgi:hypothetical protein